MRLRDVLEYIYPLCLHSCLAARFASPHLDISLNYLFYSNTQYLTKSRLLYFFEIALNKDFTIYLQSTSTALLLLLSGAIQRYGEDLYDCYRYSKPL
jgi:hypothetical protein